MGLERMKTIIRRLLNEDRERAATMLAAEFGYRLIVFRSRPWPVFQLIEV